MTNKEAEEIMVADPEIGEEYREIVHGYIIRCINQDRIKENAISDKDVEDMIGVLNYKPEKRS